QSLRFSVSDTGIGIPPDRVDSIFEAFEQADGSTTRKYGGTGLGLSISQRLVQIMGGRILVESVVGRCSTFKFDLMLPFREVAPGASGRPSKSVVAEQSAAEGHAAISGLTVLLAEDNLVNQKLAMLLLEKQEHSVTVVDDGKKAVDA